MRACVHVFMGHNYLGLVTGPECALTLAFPWRFQVLLYKRTTISIMSTVNAHGIPTNPYYAKASAIIIHYQTNVRADILGTPLT